jgi:hypothetical protein
MDAMTQQTEQPAITMGHIKFTVVGFKPLMTHNPQSMGDFNRDGAKRGSRIPEPEVEAENGTYRLDDGTCAITGESFRSTILAAASAWKIKRATMRRALEHITVIEELVALQRLNGEPIKDYIIDRRRVRVQKNSVMRARPRFDEWQCRFTVEYDPQLIREPKIIADILADSGNRIGVGDFRGRYGRFRVRDFEIG